MRLHSLEHLGRAHSHGSVRGEGGHLFPRQRSGYRRRIESTNRVGRDRVACRVILGEIDEDQSRPRVLGHGGDEELRVAAGQVFRQRLREREHLGPLSFLSVFATGVYGGYFGAAQGIMLLAILGLSLPDEHLQRINAVKVVLAGLVNLIAGIIFVFAAHIAWVPALLIAIGSTIGGVLGARYGRRLPPTALRAVIVAVGIFAIIRLL